MSKKQQWEKVGGGSYGVYKPKKQTDWDAIWGWVFTIGVAVFLLSMCSG